MGLFKTEPSELPENLDGTTPQGEYVSEDTLRALAGDLDDIEVVHYLMKGSGVTIEGGESDGFVQTGVVKGITRRGVSKSVPAQSGITFVCTESALLIKSHRKEDDKVHRIEYESITSIKHKEEFGESLSIVVETSQRTYRCAISVPEYSEIIEAVRFVSKQSDSAFDIGLTDESIRGLDAVRKEYLLGSFSEEEFLKMKMAVVS